MNFTLPGVTSSRTSIEPKAPSRRALYPKHLEFFWNCSVLAG